MRKIALTAIALALAVSAAAGTRTVLAAPVAQTKKTQTKTVAQAAQASAAEKKNETPKVMVTVAEGDSLSSIAEAHQSTWVRVFNANETVANPDIINPGQELRIPDASEELTDRPLPQPVVVAAPVVQTSYQAPATTTYRAAAPSYSAANYPTDPNAAKAFIYSRESGNNPNATNAGGCYGIGQDCNGVVRGTCGADYACQDAYFTNYAMKRYGSWEAAQAFWNANGWW